MGLAIQREQFEDQEYQDFACRLDECLLALKALLERPGFGEGPPSLGAELEFYLVDDTGRPLLSNREVLAETVDPRMTVELNRFNLECNLRHGPLAGRPFDALGRELEDAVDELRRAASLHGGRVAMVGILPTLLPKDLQPEVMTDTARFRALSSALARLRQEPFRLDIGGDESLSMPCNDVTFEGAATSLQLHLRVAPGDFAPLYNAMQMATAPALAISCNSPILLEHRLWEETRVALFKQAVDYRNDQERRERRAARVSFGTRWVERGALELFEENVRLHEPLLPVMGDEDPSACVRSGGVPRLDEIRLHQGTVWRWNRAIYDPADGGHLRIEMRALPAGPSIPDMLANTAFLVGLGLGLAPDMRDWIRGFAFDSAHSNFYRAAQQGLGAELLWPRAPGEEAVSSDARELVLRMIPLAQAGLEGAGVDADQARTLLSVIEERTRCGMTGSAWQRLTLEALEARGLTRRAALHGMLERYLEHSSGTLPVHRWPVES
ncbi:MAG: glutamate--cysteine ligase [Deltaproteobacteria bacterium]|nr:glutamate--cysteine ligase [Deltaproteobacteria bacterium]MBW2419749.1 glutamate--cysteine ligase [Deltaproteobacteria bacterium]